MAPARSSSAPASAARGSFADMLNRAAYAKERVIVTRRGKALAAIVPMEDVKTLAALEDERDAQLIAKRKAAWRRTGRKSTPIEDMVRKHRAKP